MCNICLLKIRVMTKHSGFIRMALQEGAHLVPILSFGEVDIMDNVRFPFLQQWFLKTAGMVFPHQPYGLYYLPIPRKCSVWMTYYYLMKFLFLKVFGMIVSDLSCPSLYITHNRSTEDYCGSGASHTYSPVRCSKWRPGEEDNGHLHESSSSYVWQA